MNPRFGEVAVCCAWGLTSGQWTADELAELCASHGVQTVCYQVIPENDPHGPALHDACRSRGLHFGGWTNVPQQVKSPADLEELLDRIHVYGCGFFAANVEERWAYGGTVFRDDGTIENPNGCHRTFLDGFRARFPLKPACVQTNFGGFEAVDDAGHVVPGYDQHAQAFYTSRHFDCQHEDYLVDNPNLSPAEGDFTANNQWGLRFPGPSSSMIGTYDGWHVRDYRQALAVSGRHRVQWVYLPEEWDDQDWQDVARPTSP
jgi:hypothetical protein